MKTRIIYAIILSLLFLIIFSACEKPENEIEKPGIEAPPSAPGPATPIGG